MTVPTRGPAARNTTAPAWSLRKLRVASLLAGALLLAACAPMSAPLRSSEPDPIRAENSGLLAEQNLPGAERYAVPPPSELPGPLPGKVPLAPPGRPGSLRLPGLAEAPPRATDIPEFPTLDDLEVEARLERLAKLPPSVGLDIVRTGLTQKGRRYRRAGVSPATGFDCSGFTQWTFRQHGMSLPRTAREQYQAGIRISTDELRAGDLVFYKINRRGRWHVGIYMEDGVFVHSPRPGRGISEANMQDRYWSKRYLGARRYAR